MTMSAGVDIVGTGTNATSGADVVDVELTHVVISANRVPASLCSFQLVGSIRGRLSEATQLLSLGSSLFTLRVNNLTGCQGFLANGNAVSVNAAMDLSSPDGALGLS